MQDNNMYNQPPQMQQQPMQQPVQNIILATTDSIPGREVQCLGLVQGSIVRAKDIGRSFMGGLKAGTVGGEIGIYTDLLNEARSIAIERLIAQARAYGADAVTGVRIATCSVVAGCSEVTAYGTAVKFK